MHKVNERQLAIVKILKTEKFVKVRELQEKLGVTRRTIRYDLSYLRRVYPDNIISHSGRYTGGIEWVGR